MNDAICDQLTRKPLNKRSIYHDASFRIILPIDENKNSFLFMIWYTEIILLTYNIDQLLINW